MKAKVAGTVQEVVGTKYQTTPGDNPTGAEVTRATTEIHDAEGPE